MKYKSPYAEMFKKPSPATRVRFEIALDSVTDKDIIDRINQVNNKSDYVRQLIREDIKKGSI